MTSSLFAMFTPPIMEGVINMLIENRKELKDMFDKCGTLARYHIAEAEKCKGSDTGEFEKHEEVIKACIRIRADLIHLILEGT